MEESPINLPQSSIILSNLKTQNYKLVTTNIDGRVLSMTSIRENLFLAIAGKGIIIFKVEHGDCSFSYQLHTSKESTEVVDKIVDNGVSCYQLSVTDRHLLYIKELKGNLSVCVHHCVLPLAWYSATLLELEISRQAPIVMDSELNILCIGCSAWSVSWTTQGKSNTESDESHIRTIDMQTWSTLKQWKAVENGISLLRHQISQGHHMIGIADSRTGICVYDLKQPLLKTYTCLYNVPVEEIRNFDLVGNFVAVFHKFEPNVTFWNMSEQKTILCINIQDQMRELANETLDDDDDCGLYGDDDDHVTSITSVPSDEDFVLIYGTKSGCIFGISVNNRNKLFSIPCPFDCEGQTSSAQPSIQDLQYVSPGKIILVYDKRPITMLDFSLKESG